MARAKGIRRWGRPKFGTVWGGYAAPAGGGGGGAAAASTSKSNLHITDQAEETEVNSFKILSNPFVITDFNESAG